MRFKLMDKLTLDTNILRDWAWAEKRTTEIRYINDPTKRETLIKQFIELSKLRNQGICELGISTQIFTDYEKSIKELPQYIEDMIGPYVTFATPSISKFPMIIPFVLINKAKIDEILLDVFPNAKPDDRKYESKKKDAYQLYAHLVAKIDIFLTSDKRILEANKILSIKWMIQVKTLEEYLYQNLRHK